ncbi:hypothetical protein ACFL6K_05875 [Candidatus Latescibacterota bacterium]
MRKYWKLYIKELRFLLWPAIVISVMQIALGSFMTFSYYHFNSFYENYIHNIPQNPPFIWRIIVFPVIMTASFIGLTYVFSALFLYSLLNEHFTCAKYQIYSLPLRRWKHIAVKLAAICSWAVFVLVAGILYVRASYLIEKVVFNELNPFAAYHPFDVIVISTLREISRIVLNCSLVMIGYVAAMCIKRFPAFVGTATVFAGYFCYRKLYQFFYYKFASQTSGGEGFTTPQMVISPWFNVLFPGAMAIIFIVAALFIYEKYSEV